MSKYNLKRIDLYVRQYKTGAAIRVEENQSSCEPHLVTIYDKVDSIHHGRKEVAAAVPADWTDRDSTDLVFNEGA
jgi:hypothetical protein